MLAGSYGYGGVSVFERIEVRTRGLQSNVLNMRHIMLASPDDGKPQIIEGLPKFLQRPPLPGLNV